MKTLLILLMTTSIANAALLDAPFGEPPLMPPLKYIGNIFKGTIQIRRLPKHLINSACDYLFSQADNGYLFRSTGRGCMLRTSWVTDPKAICYIILPDKQYGKIKPIDVYIHEKAHCNGWNAFHDN